MQTSKEERAQWAELCAKATPGPWESFALWIQAATRRLAGFNIGRYDEHGRSEGQRNLDFCCAARTALPRLLADYDELERESDQERDVLLKRAKELTGRKDLHSGYEGLELLAQRNAELERKVREFLTKLAEVEPAIDNAFVFMNVHGHNYNGPTYGVEIAVLRAAVEK